MGGEERLQSCLLLYYKIAVGLGLRETWAVAGSQGKFIGRFGQDHGFRSHAVRAKLLKYKLCGSMVGMHQIEVVPAVVAEYVDHPLIGWKIVGCG